MQHCETGHLFLDKLVDQLVEILHDWLLLFGALFQDGLEVGRDLVGSLTLGSLGLAEDGVFGTVPFAEHEGFLRRGGNLTVNVVDDPGGFGVVDQTADVAVELGNDHVADLGVTVREVMLVVQGKNKDKDSADSPFNDHFGNQELAVLALGQLAHVGAQFGDNLFPLLLVCVLEGALDDTHTVVLEDKVAHSARDDFEQLADQSLALVGGDVRLPAQSLPDLLTAGNDVGVRFGGLALLCKCTLGGVCLC